MSQILSHLAFQAANALGITTSSSFLSADHLTQDGTVQTQIQEAALSNFERVQIPPMLSAIVDGITQTAGVEQLASLSPHLPPTWQMVVGGLLYGEPAIRATSRAIRKIISLFTRPAEEKIPPAKPQTLTQTMNQITGTIERKIRPFRTTALIGLNIYAGVSILFFDSPVVEHIPAAIANALSLWNYHDRTDRVEKAIVRHQIDSGEKLHPAGWRAQEARALGVFAPDVPKNFPGEHVVGLEPPPYAQGAKPGFSLLRNLRGLVMTASMLTGVMRRSHVYTEGTWNTFKSWLTSLRAGRHAPVSEKYLEAVDVMLPQWVMRLCEIYGVSLKFRDLEKLKSIPQGAPVVFGAFPHSAIYTDFAFWYALPRARFVADEHNFHDALVIRAIALAWFLDVIALLFVSRKKNKSNPINSRTSLAPPSGNSMPPSLKNGNGNGSNGTDLYKQTTDRMAKYGIQPVYFGQAGRAPRSFRDDRSLARPGLHSNVVDPKKPERYYNLNGTINTALAAAKQSGNTAYIPILHIEGSGRVLPKISKNPPFIQPVQPGEVTFGIGDMIPVSSPVAYTSEIHSALTEAAKSNDLGQALETFQRGANQAEHPEFSQALERILMREIQKALDEFACQKSWDHQTSLEDFDKNPEEKALFEFYLILHERLSEVALKNWEERQVTADLAALASNVSSMVKNNSIRLTGVEDLAALATATAALVKEMGIERQIIDAAKHTMGINEYLRKEVVRWADQAGTPSAADDFANVADKDKYYYIIADRIRSVHPNLAQRNEFKSRLLNLSQRASAGEFVTEELRILLKDVSRIVKETEYQSQ